MRPETVSFLLDLNRQFYQQFGPAFAATRQRIQPGVRRLLERLPMKGRWLDLGSGNGELARELGRREFEGEYAGLDFSRELIEYAQKTWRATNGILHQDKERGEKRAGPHPQALETGEMRAGPHPQALETGEMRAGPHPQALGTGEMRAGPHPPAPSPLRGEGEEDEKFKENSFNTPKVPPILWERLRMMAREMRHEPTPAENLLWQHLRNRQISNLKFRRQHAIDRFIVDFYCAEIGLVIEVDGPIHQFTVEEDALRQEFLESLGLKVIHFENEMVTNNIDQIVQKIINIVVSSPPLYSMERGPGGEVERPINKHAYKVEVPTIKSFQPVFQLVDLSDPGWSSIYKSASLDVVLAFAVLHHLPGESLRREVLSQARRLLRPGGQLIHSEWQFQNSPRLLGRVQPWEKAGLNPTELDKGDALLDWRYNLPGQPEAAGLRYVHRFSLEELARLAETCGFRILETFESDGQGGKLGLYQVWESI